MTNYFPLWLPTGPMTDNPDGRTLEIPEELASRIDRRVARTEFDSTAAYVTHVLEEVLYHVEQHDSGDESFETVDEDEVRDRLRSLGYITE